MSPMYLLSTSFLACFYFPDMMKWTPGGDGSANRRRHLTAASRQPHIQT